MIRAYKLPAGAQWLDCCDRCGWVSDPGDTMYEDEESGRVYCSRSCAERARARHRERKAAAARA